MLFATDGSLFQVRDAHNLSNFNLGTRKKPNQPTLKLTYVGGMARHLIAPRQVLRGMALAKQTSPRTNFTVKTMNEHLPPVIAAMLQPEFYSDMPAEVELRQTHISYVLLPASTCTKLKSPSSFRFLITPHWNNDAIFVARRYDSTGGLLPTLTFA